MSDDLPAAEQRAREYGIDVSLIEARLRMTPSERVEAHERAMALAEALAAAMEKRRARDGTPPELIQTKRR